MGVGGLVYFGGRGLNFEITVHDIMFVDCSKLLVAPVHINSGH